MINARMMYHRPGNLFHEFIIEGNNQGITSTGRAASSFLGDGTNTLKGCLAEASEKEKGSHNTSDNIVTHTIVQSGAPKAKRNQRLIFKDRVFFIVDVDNTGGLGIATLYYVEERTGVK